MARPAAARGGARVDGRRWASTSSLAGRWGPDDRLRAAEGNGTGTAEATPVAAHLTLSRRRPQPRRGSRRSARGPRRGREQPVPSFGQHSRRPRTSIGIARLEQVDPGERVGRAGQQQRRDVIRGQWAMRAAAYSGPPGDGAGRTGRRAPRTGHAARPPRGHARRERRDPASERVAADDQPGSSGTWASKAAIASSALRFGRSRASASIPRSRARRPTAASRRRCPRRHGRDRSAPSRPRYRTAWHAGSPARRRGWSHRPMARAGTATSRLGSMPSPHAPGTARPNRTRPPRPLGAVRARAVVRRRRRAGVAVDPHRRRPAPPRPPSARRSPSRPRPRRPRLRPNRARASPSRLLGAPTRAEAPPRRRRLPHRAPSPTPTASPTPHRRHAHAHPDAAATWPAPGWPTTVTTLGATDLLGPGLGPRRRAQPVRREGPRARRPDRGAHPQGLLQGRQAATVSPTQNVRVLVLAGSRPPQVRPARHLRPRRHVEGRRHREEFPAGARSSLAADAPGGTLAGPRYARRRRRSSTARFSGASVRPTDRARRLPPARLPALELRHVPREPPVKPGRERGDRSSTTSSWTSTSAASSRSRCR